MSPRGPHMLPSFFLHLPRLWHRQGLFVLACSWAALRCMGSGVAFRPPPDRVLMRDPLRSRSYARTLRSRSYARLATLFRSFAPTSQPFLGRSLIPRNPFSLVRTVRTDARLHAPFHTPSRLHALPKFPLEILSLANPFPFVRPLLARPIRAPFPRNPPYSLHSSREFPPQRCHRAHGLHRLLCGDERLHEHRRNRLDHLPSGYARLPKVVVVGGGLVYDGQDHQHVHLQR